VMLTEPVRDDGPSKVSWEQASLWCDLYWLGLDAVAIDALLN